MNVFITGTSSGFGFGLAKNYLEKGHTVYGISRKRNETLIAYPNFRFLVQDISMHNELQTNLVSFFTEVETLDLIILNAGILNEIKDLKDTSLDEIEKVMQINVWSNKVLIDTLFRIIPEIKQVVAVSSGASVSGARGWNAYSLSKATLNMLINLYAREFTETHFSALAPGLIDTGMQDYIYSLQNDEKFPVVQRLKQAKGTQDMPKPEKAAEKFADAVEKVKEFDSGSFQDVRKL